MVVLLAFRLLPCQSQLHKQQQATGSKAGATQPKSNSILDAVRLEGQAGEHQEDATPKESHTAPAPEKWPIGNSAPFAKVLRLEG